MLASLIVCTRNRAASLDRFLSCVVGLNLPAASDWEFLVVNNGSTDQTESVIAKYKAVLPIRSVFEPKAGLSNARNRGTDEARGDYITTSFHTTGMASSNPGIWCICERSNLTTSAQPIAATSMPRSSSTGSLYTSRRLTNQKVRKTA